jgi:cytochrome c
MNFIKYSLLALSLLTTPIYAEVEKGTEKDAQSMVESAMAHIKSVGAEKAFQDFSTPGGKWHMKDVYLFCYKMDGTNTCHGANKALIGKNLIDIKTADGQPLIRNMIDITSKKNNGWIVYKWPHPKTKQTEDKKAFVMKIPGNDGFLGAGIYNQGK